MSNRYLLSLWIKLSCTLGVFAVLMLAAPSHSTIYKWKDESGKTHFTDNPSRIPPKYRKKDELKIMKGIANESAEPVKLLLPKKKGGSHVIKAKSVGGGHYMVEVLINGTVSADLIVDTGASMIVLSDRIGKRLGVYHNSPLPKIEMSTAGGKVEAPLLVLNTVQLGDAEAFNVEASTNPHMQGMDGLLGMTFLSQFKVEMDQQKSEMILKPLGSPEEKLWDNKNETWWKKKYETYAGTLRNLERAAYQARGDMKETRKIKKFIEHYEKLHKGLEKRADRVRLPKEFRSYP